MTTSALGPCLTATITTDRIDTCVKAWCDHLYQSKAHEERVSATQAEHWGMPALAGSRSVWLSNASGEPWLRFIEDASAAPVDPFRHTGWLSLEINVLDVDALHQTLLDTPFRIIGHPADLDVSPHIRAMQVMGPAGEVLYLTQIKQEVPGFDLPSARSAVDRLFIPVLLVSDRDEALALYEQFPNTQGNRFETRITVLNQAHDLTAETRHPVATVQLTGKSLIEIDELTGLTPRPVANCGLPTGISMIGLGVTAAYLEVGAINNYDVELEPYQGNNARLIKGKAGEWIELIGQ